jgi:thymidylate synthase
MHTWVTKTGDSYHDYFYGAYGTRLGCNPPLGELRTEHMWRDGTVCPRDQFKAAYEALQADPDSRQVVMNIYNHMLDMPGEKPRNPDVPCNLISDLKVRDGKLHWMQTMRSNDLMWGTPYNFIQWTILQEVMADWLGLEVGQFTLSTSSLHVYEHHWADLDEIVQGPGSEFAELRNLVPLRTYDKLNWEKIFADVAYVTSDLSKATNYQELRAAYDAPVWSIVNRCDGWVQLVYLLVAEAARRLEINTNLDYLAKGAGPYYQKSWEIWKGYIDGKAKEV